MPGDRDTEDPDGDHRQHGHDDDAPRGGNRQQGDPAQHSAYPDFRGQGSQYGTALA